MRKTLFAFLFLMPLFAWAASIKENFATTNTPAAATNVVRSITKSNDFTGSFTGNGAGLTNVPGVWTNSAGIFRQVGTNTSVLIDNAWGSGTSIPDLNSGTADRAIIFWDAHKGSFWAGEWDVEISPGQIGNSSASFGYDGLASGYGSMVLGGRGNTASGLYSIAGGYGVTVSGDGSVGLGEALTSSGHNSVAINLASGSAATVSNNNAFTVVGGDMILGSNLSVTGAVVAAGVYTGNGSGLTNISPSGFSGDVLTNTRAAASLSGLTLNGVTTNGATGGSNWVGGISLWNPSTGNTINFTNGTGTFSTSVGIGTNLPQATLDITTSGNTSFQVRARSSGNASAIVDRFSTANQANFYLLTRGTNTWAIGQDSTSVNDLYFYSYGLGNYPFYIKYVTGNIGIGTTSPGTKLDVSGNLNLSTTTNWIKWTGVAQSNPPTSGAGTAFIFAATNGGTAELFAMDGAGNVTQFSPHAGDAPASLQDSTDEMPLIVKEVNIYTGTARWLNLSRMARRVEQMETAMQILAAFIPTNGMTALQLTRLNAVINMTQAQKDIISVTTNYVTPITWASVQARIQSEYATSFTNAVSGGNTNLVWSPPAAEPIPARLVARGVTE